MAGNPAQHGEFCSSLDEAIRVQNTPTCTCRWAVNTEGVFDDRGQSRFAVIKTHECELCKERKNEN